MRTCFESCLAHSIITINNIIKLFRFFTSLAWRRCFDSTLTSWSRFVWRTSHLMYCPSVDTFMLYCSCVDAFAYLLDTDDELILLHSIKILLLYFWILMLWLDAFIFYTFEIPLSSSLRTSSTTSPTTWGRAMTPRYFQIDYDTQRKILQKPYINPNDHVLSNLKKSATDPVVVKQR